MGMLCPCSYPVGVFRHHPELLTGLAGCIVFLLESKVQHGVAGSKHRVQDRRYIAEMVQHSATRS